MQPPRVVILASDRITADGALAYLRNQPELDLLPASQQHRADVLLLLVDTVTETTLALMREADERSTNPAMRIVLVANDIQEHHLTRAIGYGLVSVLPRTDVSYHRIVKAILDSTRGQADMPATMVGWLVEQSRTVQRDILAPNGLTVTSLEARELAVIRLIADGLDTREIAEQLNYSERTVKNVIHSMMARLRLRNRPHAVAYALRCGAM
ncbi:MAG TPA: response regulator transcription factor [Pseudonocardiaceae bacterium]|nr:response regulator transcription factor [Pseudonocardiaceae bacterium]